jgi:hypothetical protein
MKYELTAKASLPFVIAIRAPALRAPAKQLRS